MSQSARYAERPHDARKYSIHGGKLAPIHGTVNASRYVGWRSPGRAGRASSAAAASAAGSAAVGDGEDGARAPNFRSLPVPCRHGLTCWSACSRSLAESASAWPPRLVTTGAQLPSTTA
jgi:hypothetical protein